MDFELTAEQAAWRDEVRNFLTSFRHPGHLDPDHDLQSAPELAGFRRQLIERGWYGLNLPVEFGGLGRSAIDRLIMVDEFERVGAPHLDLTITSLAAIIARHGTPDNRARWLPPIMRGEIEMALAYSEPDAGTDLASLRTSAERDGDEWVVTGQKIWNSRAHLVTHEWVAVRTDPAAPKHRGISIVIVPVDAPGVEVTPLYTWGYDRTNLTYFDHVRVPAENLIGETGKGWTYINGSLDFERVVIGSAGALWRLYDLVVELCRERGLDAMPEVDLRLAELRVDLEVAQLLGYRTASLIDAGVELSAEASVQKVFSSELRTRLADTAMEILGPESRLSEDQPGAPLAGLAEATYRAAPMFRFGGGASEVMRDLIARRGLGMPRG